MRFDTEALFQITAEQLFRTVVDLENAPSWHSFIHHVENVTDGEIGLGTRWRNDFAWFGIKGGFELEIVTWEPFEKVVFHGSKVGTMEPHFIIHFRECAAGTLLHYEIRPVMHSKLVGVLADMFGKPYGRKDMGRYFDALRLNLEPAAD